MALPIPILGTYSSVQRGAYWEVAVHAAAFEGGMKGLNALDRWKIRNSGFGSYDYGKGHGKSLPKWRSPSHTEKVGRLVGTAAMNPVVAGAAVTAPAAIVSGIALNEIVRKLIGSEFYTTPYTSGFGPVV